MDAQVGGAVERINHPGGIEGEHHVISRAFLTNELVARKAALQVAQDEFLALLVGISNKIERRLVLNATQRRTHRFANELTGLQAGEQQSDVEQ